jgi:hypothetical protein
MNSDATQWVYCAEVAGGAVMRRVARWWVNGYSPGKVAAASQVKVALRGVESSKRAGGGGCGRSRNNSNAAACFSFGSSSKMT